MLGEMPKAREVKTNTLFLVRVKGVEGAAERKPDAEELRKAVHGADMPVD